MKNIKGKFISIFMTFVMIVSILGINVVNAFADGNSNSTNVVPSISPQSVEVYPGDSFVLNISSSEAGNILAYKSDITGMATGFSRITDDKATINISQDVTPGDYTISDIGLYNIPNANVPPQMVWQNLTDTNKIASLQEVKVVVKEQPKVNVESISLNNPSASLSVGETLQLTATIVPDNATNKNVTWTSSDTSIAAVDEAGKVTAAKEGNVTITAATEDGQKTATCAVTVNNVQNTTIHVSMIIDGYKGNILNEDSIEASAGETVCSMFERELKNKGITYTNTSEASPYISKIAGEGERDRGFYSGWKYSVNGTFPNVGCGSVKLNDGDKIHWIYVQGYNDETVFRDVDSITLDKTTLDLKANDTQKITATVNPDDATDKDLTWTSSDTSIATVDANGNVTAVKEGTATITAAAKDNGKYTQNYTNVTSACAVIVKGDSQGTVSVTGVSLDKTTGSLSVGETLQLTETIAPDTATDKNVTWTSSDETIATVDATGKVTALKEGKATIMVTTEDGKKTATCSVAVTKKQISPTDNTFTMVITRDNGTSTIKTFTMTIDKDKKNENAMDYLKSVTKVTELQGPGFINGIDGLLNVFLKDMPIEDRKAGYYGVDWFIYLNGSLTPVGATGVHPKAGDTLNFDYHKWDWHSLVAPGTKTMPLRIENVPSSVDSGKSIKLRVTCVFRGVYNVSVKVDDKEVTTTDIDGYAEITINDPGNHTITVEKDGALKNKTITVNKGSQEIVPVTEITLDKTTGSLTVGSTLQLIAAVQPDTATNKDITWTSSDATIAAVDATGKVTAAKEGTATITATTVDGQKTATCIVTVTKAEAKDYTTSINNLIGGISSTVTTDNCDDWLALGLNKTGKNIPEGYLSKLEKRVKDATKAGVLDLGNPTEYERLTLAVLACGGDPTNIAGQNIVEKIYNNKDMDSQGINAYVFGLIALDAGKFTVPDNTTWTRQKLIDKILTYKTSDGGWSYGGDTADPDMTAMAISALAPYVNSNNDVKTAVNNAIDRLSQIQGTDGKFKSWGSESSESISQVIIGLCANGVDPTTDSKFIKNNITLIDALLSFASTDNKGFGHTDNTISPMGTEQGLEALAAYNLFKAGKGSLYSFDAQTPENKTIKITNVTTKTEYNLGDDAKISIKAENDSNKDQDVSLILALYDGNGEFVDYVSGNQTIKKGDSSILTSMLKLPSQGIYTLKGFVWDSLEAMNPLSDVLEIPVK